MGIDGGAVKFDRNETFYNSSIGAYKATRRSIARLKTHMREN